jgi:hypothetical protein
MSKSKSLGAALAAVFMSVAAASLSTTGECGGGLLQDGRQPSSGQTRFPKPLNQQPRI